FRRMLTATNIKRLYGFVKCDRAEGLRGARPGPPRPDPGRRAADVRPRGLRGCDCGQARAGDRPVARRDLQLLPGQVVALPRPGRRGSARLHALTRGGRDRRTAACFGPGAARVARRVLRARAPASDEPRADAGAPEPLARSVRTW